ncbi:CRISPR-associated helicase Cas3' [Rhodovulum visakhapatnamense]|uniref:CRISPR-associated helicase Cas3' n=1 Tax=Rhodovulum visakhapatnamense TaxID=364297 RepID=UPI003075D12D
MICATAPTQGSPESLCGAAAQILHWPSAPGLTDWFFALFAHHGRPVPEPSPGKAAAAFPPGRIAGYDWRAQETVMGRALLDWFPEIGRSSAPSPKPALLHFFCGLLTLADWIGSDRKAFPFEGSFRSDYWETARDRANERVADIGLAEGSLHLRAAPGWALISDYPSPRPAQEAVGDLPVNERLVLLEAETGSGKTEAALWRFATLVAAGEVDALYFAVPTRAAARQLQRRVNAALQRMFDPTPEAILAVPGQLLSGEAAGRPLPGFAVLWDDTTARPARWAAEHAARFLAAQVAVGTVDQVALGGLRAKYAHLRGSALSRALVVIDEVHASDAYMTEVQLAMVRSHLALGGHAMLMSATLGAAARRKWLNEAVADLATDIARPYPAIWTTRGPQPVAPDNDADKAVHIEVHRGWSGDAAAVLALEAANRGARVLVIRNTVMRAQETFAACNAARPDLLLAVDGQPTLHHSRFAVEDRALLDIAVEEAIGKDSPQRGRIVIGTQTLEQSLDLCADLLITDLCPMDVLLQRIGRLHRHRRLRPSGFEAARAVVMCPPDGLDPLTRTAENGLGAYADGPSLSGIYVDVPGLAATLAEIEARPVWQIPTMNRALVEAATHPDALDRIATAQGWQSYRQRVSGRALAEMSAAGLVLLDRTAQLPRTFPDDERIRTRLGEDGVILTLPEGTRGAFGQPITRLALPAHWSRGLTGEEEVQVDPGPPMRMTVSDRAMSYGSEGLMQDQGNRHGA